VRAALEKMKARGAEIVDVSIPGLDSVINRAGVIDFEFKYDLIDYLATIPNAPIKSLGEILDRGLYDVALDAQLRRRERQGTRDGAAYRAALSERVVGRDLVTAFLDANKLDALVYPTLRRKAAIIGEPQRGANCQLSAVTGLPALTMPAGFTVDGLPIGVELLGRPLADARLLSIAYDYERFAHPRRAPSTTPPLVDGRAPKPVPLIATARNGSAGARGTFTFDPTRRSLAYTIQVTGTPVEHVYAMSIDRDSAGRKGSVIRHLSNGGVAHAVGTLSFRESDRVDLLTGRLALVVYTTEHPDGSLRGAIVAGPAR
jgi:amidase